MRRILSFHGFHLILRCHLILDFFRIVFAPVRRRIPPVRDNPWQSLRPTGAEKSNNTIKIRERTNPSHQRYPWTFWTRADWAEGEGANQLGSVFQTAVPSCFINPETSSRVTLALLAIVFQTKPPSTDTYYSTNAIICYWWLPWSVPVMYSPQK